MTRGHNKVECCSGSHLEESSFRSKDLSLLFSARSPGTINSGLSATEERQRTWAWLARTPADLGSASIANHGLVIDECSMHQRAYISITPAYIRVELLHRLA